MGSKREEVRNEKIIRGLMKLPPNRRCINCNSLGPQYVCTNFWTFICMPCSGVHREFTHRVKSVSMAKFTSQEVDELQKGGNQRARELFLKAWDPQSQRLPDNSNPDRVREFIKHVYVDKRYAIEKMPEKPPRDPQTIRSHEDETRRASSYHSFSQSPPYDFQYEERRYGKPIPSLGRKPGSDRGLYDGKLSSFSSPGQSSDQAYDERFANEGSWPRVSDYSVSSGGDPFRSDVLSPNFQRETWSPFSESETSSNFTNEVHGHHTFLHSSKAHDGSRRVGHPQYSYVQRTSSLGSIGSFDSMSFKSVSSVAAAEAQQSVGTSQEKASPLPSLPQSSASSSFNGLDLFNEPFSPQNTTSPKTVCNSQSPETLLPQPLDLFQQSPISSAPTLTEQQPSETLLPATLEFAGLPQPQPIAGFDGMTSDVVMAQKEAWATFDVSQNSLIMGSKNSTPAAVPSSDGNNLLVFNPFSLDHCASNQKDPPSLEHSALTHALWQDNLQNAETTTNNTQEWNAFDYSTGKQPVEYKLEDRGQAPVLYDSNDNRSLGSGVYEVLPSDGNFRTSYGIQPPSTSVSLHSSMALQSFSFVPEAGVHPVATAHKPTNPFDFPCDADLAPTNMTQFWDMSSLQAALPSNQGLATYVNDVNESWFTQNTVPYTPGAVAFDPPNAGSLGYIVGQVPTTHIPSSPAQGPVSSTGGNPFA
ncbi:probable ADP-ribosylation factor GTPase-activating protein AGD14 isoform X1 [Salvia hispanica]|uniref:probable ADP-ribosylation factor GTPase-activating protein AGD14 isoform X1 n=1 Tax=Salvia hispanica TaxID=49212 RepID=UPI002009291F|nr:probable ADP-ribosylation factor GTPase-activating protein AGD14 isoform X1 [Salvia hispanica]XP_047941686.1 probable ADP-ribosylation factor GTPase-activating protein AGD14 isoform X1 [Salvia hispanica]XP_047941687.1 probable ADP-ribosylation factor GTPase-activating protein AGD14 isoform X1 [Salvia hispanica]